VCNCLNSRAGGGDIETLGTEGVGNHCAEIFFIFYKKNVDRHFNGL